MNQSSLRGRPLLSVVLPTKHRPRFVENFLNTLLHQKYNDFEVIIADNYKDSSLSSAKMVKGDLDSGNISIISPKKYLCMVDNWNFALRKARGEYVLFFTDKMCLIPGLLEDVSSIINEHSPDIINWVYDHWNPVNYSDNFGPGFYHKANFVNEGYYDPKEELSSKSQLRPPRRLQNESQYARGKICFGAFSRKLIDTIQSKYGELFEQISPDYTSMILGLTEAKNAYEIGRSGVLHINTNISTGGNCGLNTRLAREFLDETGMREELINEMPVRGVYCSTNNSLLRDYTILKEKYSLNYDINMEKWLVEIGADLFESRKEWSSEGERKSQIDLYTSLLESLLEERKGAIIEEAKVVSSQSQRPIRNIARRILIPILQGMWPTRFGKKYDSINEGLVAYLNSKDGRDR